jgi:TPR repeat protein
MADSCTEEEKLYQSNFDSGDQSLAFKLGILYESHHWVCGNVEHSEHLKKAIYYYEIAADSGNEKAIVNFGHLVLNDSNLDSTIRYEKRSKAIELLTSISESVDYRPSYNLALYYDKLQIEDQKKKEVIGYYDKVAKLGSKIAQERIAGYYEDLGDFVQSYAWYRILKINGGNVNYYLDKVGDRMLDSEKEEAETLASSILKENPSIRTTQWCIPSVYRYPDEFGNTNKKAMQYYSKHCG